MPVETPTHNNDEFKCITAAVKDGFYTNAGDFSFSASSATQAAYQILTLNNNDNLATYAQWPLTGTCF